jgi:hypothetical protein
MVRRRNKRERERERELPAQFILAFCKSKIEREQQTNKQITPSNALQKRGFSPPLFVSHSTRRKKTRRFSREMSHHTHLSAKKKK